MWTIFERSDEIPAWRQGDEAAFAQLLPLIYDELCELAARQMRHERAEHTLQPTALVHEAYIRLLNGQAVAGQNRAHFFGAAARVMREVLVDYARAHRRLKRSVGLTRVTLAEAEKLHAPVAVDLLALDEALDALARFAPRQSRIVELRFFAGLSVKETASLLSLAPITIKREWRAARAWLFRQLNQTIT